MDGLRFEFRYDRWCGWLLGLLGMGRRFSHVTVNSDSVRIVMGWAFSVTVPRTSIAQVAESDRRVLGWGVHGCVSRDGGLTWDVSNEFVIADKGVQADLGYPSVCLADDENELPYVVRTSRV